MPKTKDPAETEPATPDMELLEVPFNGVTFVIPKDRDDWPTEGLAYLGEGKYNLFVKSTLEMAREGQWVMLCAVCPRRRDFAGFFAEFSKRQEECVG